MSQIQKGATLANGTTYQAADFNNFLDNSILLPGAISDQSSATIAAGDSILFGDVSDSNNLKRSTVTGVVDLAQNTSGLTAETTLDISADSFPFFDNSASAQRKGTFQSLFNAFTSLTALTALDVANDYIPAYDASASVTKKVSPQTIYDVLNGLTELTAVLDTDFLPIYDTSATAARKATAGNIAQAVPYVYLVDAKSGGTDAGTFTSGAWRTRDLNTEVLDTQSVCSLSSNQFTLSAGTYYIKASAPAYKVAGHMIKLRNATDAGDLLTGTTANTSAGNDVMTRSELQGRFTIAASKALEIQHQCETTRATDGFGNGFNFGVSETYTIVELWKIGT